MGANGRVQAVPSCLLVHFMAADLEESRGNTESSRQIYEDLVQGTLPKRMRLPLILPRLRAGLRCVHIACTSHETARLRGRCCGPESPAWHLL